MNQVFGNMSFIVSVDVENNNETMGLMEANFKFNPNRLVDWECYAVDCRGHKHRINIHEVDNMELNEFVD